MFWTSFKLAHFRIPLSKCYTHACCQASPIYLGFFVMHPACPVFNFINRNRAKTDLSKQEVIALCREDYCILFCFVFHERTCFGRWKVDERTQLLGAPSLIMMISRSSEPLILFLHIIALWQWSYNLSI